MRFYLGDRINSYEITSDREIGRGKHGVLYQVRHMELFSSKLFSIGQTKLPQNTVELSKLDPYFRKNNYLLPPNGHLGSTSFSLGEACEVIQENQALYLMKQEGENIGVYSPENYLALKILYSQQKDLQTPPGFPSEIRVGLSLHHPHILPLRDFGWEKYNLLSLTPKHESYSLWATYLENPEDISLCEKLLLPNYLKKHCQISEKIHFRYHQGYLIAHDEERQQNYLLLVEKSNDTISLFLCFYYFAMPFIQGKTFQEITNLPALEALHILRQALSTMEYLQQKKMIHCDLKPSHFLLQKQGGQNHAWLIDFGLSHVLLDQNLDHSVFAAGTFPYASPEKRKNEKSDIYSLGATFFQVFFGKVPLHPVEFPTFLNEQLQKITQMLKKAMNPAPEQRYSAKEFREEVEEIIQEWPDCPSEERIREETESDASGYPYLFLGYQWPGKKHYAIFRLDKPQYTVGRSEYNDICIGLDPPDRSIPRQIFTLERISSGDQYSYRLLNSSKKLFDWKRSIGSPEEKEKELPKELILEDGDYFYSKKNRSNIRWYFAYSIDYRLTPQNVKIPDFQDAIFKIPCSDKGSKVYSFLDSESSLDDTFELPIWEILEKKEGSAQKNHNLFALLLILCLLTLLVGLDYLRQEKKDSQNSQNTKNSKSIVENKKREKENPPSVSPIMTKKEETPQNEEKKATPPIRWKFLFELEEEFVYENNSFYLSVRAEDKRVPQKIEEYRFLFPEKKQLISTQGNCRYQFSRPGRYPVELFVRTKEGQFFKGGSHEIEVFALPTYLLRQEENKVIVKLDRHSALPEARFRVFVVQDFLGQATQRKELTRDEVASSFTVECYQHFLQTGGIKRIQVEMELGEKSFTLPEQTIKADSLWIPLGKDKSLELLWLDFENPTWQKEQKKILRSIRENQDFEYARAQYKIFRNFLGGFAYKAVNYNYSVAHVLAIYQITDSQIITKTREKLIVERDKKSTTPTFYQRYQQLIELLRIREEQLVKSKR